MATRGQRPKPAALRLLNGNAGKRPVNTQEPDTGPADTSPPEWLTQAATPHWARLAPMLAKAGVLKQSDRDLLATYCETFAAYLEAVQAGGASMAMVGQLRQLMGELGMTPSARARITTDKAPEVERGKARFFAA
ncbi:MAG: P27 family phage terminase small subunit [Achromobacter sp.]|uniref:P27 family phage terminase small subunit n=1 Tax=Achromobacter sp. TaxID=134375 RepID=UPI00258C782F|nr:P27 family phage terminase small subunit [Achromobacter sp.]MCW0207271.1 P27 family phage terminase small subunit [Achromobacter sp.]